MYPSIDMEKTGMKLKIMMRLAGYDVKYIQKYLHLSCPQSIYRWFKGKALPSVEHLCALSFLFDVHVEELLAFQQKSAYDKKRQKMKDKTIKRLFTYYDKMHKVA